MAPRSPAKRAASPSAKKTPQSAAPKAVKAQKRGGRAAGAPKKLAEE